jgi:hypothetical protein
MTARTPDKDDMPESDHDDPMGDPTWDDEDYDAGEECGRWRNGKLVAVYWCSQAGTEFCDFDCPYRDGD